MTTLKSPITVIKGWSYDVTTDCYKHISGITVDRTVIDGQGPDILSALDNVIKMSGTTLPPGAKFYDALVDQYIMTDGARIDGQSIRNGSYYIKNPNVNTKSSVGAIGAPLQYPKSMYNAIGQHMSMTPHPYSSQSQSGSFTISNPPDPNNFVITTDKGVVTLNLKTGDITFPLEIGRDEAIRDFWMGFQKYFGSSDVDEVAKLKTKLKETEQAAEEYKKYVYEKTVKGVVDKISKKYANEKFIMTKPADLIKLIEEA